ncbi:MAG: aminofutalosine synthase MqnE [Deltaproteobacteria bacterium]|nr:MAG: aminofutalosine synthase MqnE [Deltaproteobacteria bacterium]
MERLPIGSGLSESSELPFAARWIQNGELADIYEKVVARQRLSREDGLRLFESQDLLTIGFLANLVRERLHGQQTYWVYNQHINYSNICVNGCRFCAFSRRHGEEGGFVLSVDQVAAKVRERLQEPITEIHVVGGCHPDLPFSYYLDLVREIKKLRPLAHIKAFTVVEVAHLAQIERLSVTEVLQEFQKAGVEALPGGGAEVFSTRVRELLCPEKLSSDGWLLVARQAHKLGIRSNATLLYGHLESPAERVDHMLALREAQDETGGFITFIPLAFQTANTSLSGVQGRTGFTDLKTIAVARLLLDNFAHIKAYWIMLGVKMAQTALYFGADDLDGTVMEERIGHMAGASSAEALTPDELQTLILAAGMEPVQRDTFFRPVRPEADAVTEPQRA